MSRLRRRLVRSLRSGCFTLAGRITGHVSVESSGLIFVVPTWDQRVARKLFVAKRRKEMKRLAVALRHLGPDRGVFLDVGANMGTTCLPALHAHAFSRAIAVEPDESNARLLAANAALNGLDERVTIHQVAASDRDGTVHLSTHPSNSGGHRVTDGFGREVPAVTLDALLAAEGLSAADVGMLWIDVQGHELAVLRGARSLLEARIPFVVEQSAPSDDEWGELTRGYASVSLGRGAVDDVLFLRADSRPDPVLTR